MRVESKTWSRMTVDDRMSSVLAVLDARVQLLESRFAAEMRVKEELRSKQITIAEQEQELMMTLQSNSVNQPALFRVGELRLRKLVEDQRRLQTVLAKAALQRSLVHDQLRATLRQRLALTVQIERRSTEASDPYSSVQDDLALRHAWKRHQNVS